MNPRISAGPSRRPPGGCPAAQAAGIPASQKAGGSKGRPGVPARPRRALPRHPPCRPAIAGRPAGAADRQHHSCQPSAARNRAVHRRHHSSGHHSAGAIAPACRHAADRQPLHTAAGIPAAAGSARRSSARPGRYPAEFRRTARRPAIARRRLARPIGRAMKGRHSASFAPAIRRVLRPPPILSRPVRRLYSAADWRHHARRAKARRQEPPPPCRPAIARRKPCRPKAAPYTVLALAGTVPAAGSGGGTPGDHAGRATAPTFACRAGRMPHGTRRRRPPPPMPCRPADWPGGQ